jgi:Flp pilus assembly protein TadG
MSRRTWLRPLLCDERGVSAVEFAFLIPILSVLILGIIDLGSGLSQRFTLQQAVNRSLEMVQANSVDTGTEGGTPDYSFLKTEVAAAAGVSEGNVTLTQWLECNGTRQGSYTGTCASDQDTARYLELRVTKAFKGKMYLKTTNLVATSAVRVQ